MNDFEITKRCAKKMGHTPIHPVEGSSGWRCFAIPIYDPLHDDAQAMALVKKFGLHISTDFEDSYLWSVSLPGRWGSRCSAENHDLNSAICECVARMP